MLEKAAAVAFKVRRAKRALSRKLVKVIAVIIELYRTVRRERADHYVSSSVRFRGIWRDWPTRAAVLQHLGDDAVSGRSCATRCVRSRQPRQQRCCCCCGAASSSAGAAAAATATLPMAAPASSSLLLAASAAVAVTTAFTQRCRGN